MSKANAGVYDGNQVGIDVVREHVQGSRGGGARAVLCAVAGRSSTLRLPASRAPPQRCVNRCSERCRGVTDPHSQGSQAKDYSRHELFLLPAPPMIRRSIMRSSGAWTKSLLIMSAAILGVGVLVDMRDGWDGNSLWVLVPAIAITLTTAVRVSAMRKLQLARDGYRGHLVKLQEDALAHRAQRAAEERYEYPDVSGLFRMARRAPETRWRVATDQYYLHLGIGRGRLAPLPTLAVASPQACGADAVSQSLLDEVIRSANEPQDDRPLLVNLRWTTTMAIFGDPPLARAVLRVWLCQLALTHSPKDLVTVVRCSRETESHWTWLLRMRAPIAPAKQNLLSSSLLTSSEELVNLLQHEVDRRLDEAARLVNNRLSFRPHVVVVVDDQELSVDRQLAMIQSDVDLGSLGITMISLGRLQSGPNDSRLDCRLLLEPELVANFQRGTEAVPLHVEVLDQAKVSILSGRMGMPEGRNSREAGLTGEGLGEDLLEVLGIDDVETFDIEQAWESRNRLNVLSVPIGSADGQPLYLDLKESAKGGLGPHGLLLGATGSGKSELLRTLVLALAVTHPPERLALVLIDHKGGGTFASLGQLPHTAGVVTNISGDQANMTRLRDGLYGEVKRRQDILRDAGNLTDIHDYYEQQEQEGQAAQLPALPHLVIIVDEFSELLAERPDLSDLFQAVGRTGRALGIHLLFSSQRVDQRRLLGLESLLSYRIVLRTFSEQESRAVLGSPAVYRLPPTPGAGYLKANPEFSAIPNCLRFWRSGPAADTGLRVRLLWDSHDYRSRRGAASTGRAACPPIMASSAT